MTQKFVFRTDGEGHDFVIPLDKKQEFDKDFESIREDEIDDYVAFDKKWGSYESSVPLFMLSFENPEEVSN